MSNEALLSVVRYSQNISVTEFSGLGVESKMHLVFWLQDGLFLNNQYVLPLKLFSQSLWLVFVFTNIYKQHNHRLNTLQSFIVVEGFDGTIKEEDWKNIIKNDSQKSKRRESIIRYKSSSVLFKSLLKFSDLASEMAVGLYQKNRSIKKVIIFCHSTTDLTWI